MVRAGDARYGSGAPGLVVFSPLPPTRTGIADYAAELLPALGRQAAVTTVVESERDLAPAPSGAVVCEVEYRRRSELHGLPHLYHLGNNLPGAYVYRAALRRPGVVLLHDPVLHHLVEALTVGRGDWVGYEAVMAENYGPAGRRLARLRRAGIFSPAQRSLLPLNRHVLDRSRGVLVHSRFAASRLEVAADVPVRVMPHHVPPTAAAQDGLDRAAARARFGIPDRDEPVALHLGLLTQSKGLELVLRALARLKDDGVACRLVVAGAEDGSIDAAKLVAARGLEERVQFLGWVPEDEFFALLRAADLLLMLRSPMFAESSGVLARALGSGLPALAYDIGPASDYPARFIEKVAYSTEPLDAVVRAWRTLLSDRDGLRRRGEEARIALRNERPPERSVAAIVRALADWTPNRMLHTSDRIDIA